MKKQTKVKLSLISTIGVSLLAVSSAAVSTFAWFQAQAQVNVSASSADPVEITVAAPDDAAPINASLFSYDYNETSSGPGYTGSLDEVTKSSFTTAASGSSNFSNLYPGYKKSFMIDVSSNAELPALKLTLTTLNTTNSTKNNLIVLSSSTTVSNPRKYIDITNAIQMYAACTEGAFEQGSEGTVTSSNVTKITPKITQGAYWTASKTNVEITVEGVKTYHAYFFYTIEFLNTEGTWYTEYYQDSSTFKKLYSSRADDYSGERFFLQDSVYGNSTCYSTLSFGLTTLTISVA